MKLVSSHENCNSLLKRLKCVVHDEEKIEQMIISGELKVENNAFYKKAEKQIYERCK